MSKRAEQKALEAYPEKTVIVYGPYPTTEHSQIDDNKCYRDGFIKGYEQAEKDFTLTWKDVRLLTSIEREMSMEYIDEHPDWVSSQEIYYTEVLNRYNKEKKK